MVSFGALISHNKFQHGSSTPSWSKFDNKLPNSRLTILPSLLIGKSGRHYIRVVVRLVVRHGQDSSDVTLAFEDAQVIKTVIDDE